MRVAELLEQLEKRLDPSGTKSVLINRLEGVVDEREDFVPCTAASAVSVAVMVDPDNSDRDNFQQELRHLVREEVSAVIGTVLSEAPEAASQTTATATLSNPAPSIPGLSSIAPAPAASSTETSAAAHLLVPKSLEDHIVKGEFIELNLLLPEGISNFVSQPESRSFELRTPISLGEVSSRRNWLKPATIAKSNGEYTTSQHG